MLHHPPEVRTGGSGCRAREVSRLLGAEALRVQGGHRQNKSEATVYILLSLIALPPGGGVFEKWPDKSTTSYPMLDFEGISKICKGNIC